MINILKVDPQLLKLRLIKVQPYESILKDEPFGYLDQLVSCELKELCSDVNYDAFTLMDLEMYINYYAYVNAEREKIYGFAEKLISINPRKMFYDDFF